MRTKEDEKEKYIAYELNISFKNGSNIVISRPSSNGGKQKRWVLMDQEFDKLMRMV